MVGSRRSMLVSGNLEHVEYEQYQELSHSLQLPESWKESQGKFTLEKENSSFTLTQYCNGSRRLIYRLERQCQCFAQSSRYHCYLSSRYPAHHR